jgi:hypothetical protein
LNMVVLPQFGLPASAIVIAIFGASLCEFVVANHARDSAPARALLLDPFARLR